MSKGKRVAILLNLQTGKCRRAILGIAAYAEPRAWRLQEAAAETAALRELAKWHADGVIAHVLDRSLADELAKLSIPVVSISDAVIDSPLTSIDSDHGVVGEMAAQYFLRRGYRHFGFFGASTTVYSVQRQSAFVKTIRQEGREVSIHHAGYAIRPPRRRRWDQSEEKLLEWLSGLPRPVAIFCSNDEHARELAGQVEWMRQEGRAACRVPDDVAILGVDNDETQCLLASPSLSSVDNPAEEIGYRAAGMLEERMAGGRRTVEKIGVPVIRIVERRSTEAFAFEDPRVRRSVEFIRRKIGNASISVDAVAAAAGMSRRSLERWFKNETGLTIVQVTNRLRVEKAMRELRESKLPMDRLAEHCGFGNYRRMGVVFKQLVGMPPGEYRRFYRVDKLA